jgi:hypothetical protein
MKRRLFIKGIVLASAGAALEACGEESTSGEGDGQDPDASTGKQDGGPDGAIDGASTTDGSTSEDASTTTDAAPGEPVWSAVPTIAFVQGVAASISIASYVSDPDGDVLTFMKNGVALPPGVTFDAAGKQFVYDGIGSIASTSGHVLTAEDG